MKPKLPKPDILYDEEFQTPVDRYSAELVARLINTAYKAGMKDAQMLADAKAAVSANAEILKNWKG